MRGGKKKKKLKEEEEGGSFDEIIHFNYCHHHLELSLVPFHCTFDIASQKHISENEVICDKKRKELKKKPL